MKAGLISKVLSICIFFIFAGGSGVNNVQAVEPENLAQMKHQLNIILITISSLRADHTSCLGYHRQTTPNFDAFAKNHVLFTNAFSTSSWQMPSTGSIFTSLYPAEHGATNINRKLDQNVNTIAEILKENSFYTVGFCCNQRLSGDYGFGQGFDFYDDYSVLMMLSNMAFGQDNSFDINKKRTNDLINDAVIRWLQNNTHKPFFLFVHYYDNHWDYLPPPPYDGLYDPNYKGDIDGTEIAREPLYGNKPSDKDVEHIVALYDGEVKQTDLDLGEILTFLKKQGRFEDSLIIVMSDHGQQFYEHGHTSNHGIFDELIHIPLAISIPDFNESKKIDSLVSSVDIVPTILDYVTAPCPAQCRGQSLKPVINGKTDRQRDFVFVEYTGGAVPNCFAARFKRYKFFCQNNEIFAYDLLTDPTEQRKIYKNKFSVEMNDIFKTIESLLIQNSADPAS